MKWQAALAGALASAVVSFMASSIAAPSVASAKIRIVGDPGGEVTSYIPVRGGARFRRTYRHRRSMPVGVHLTDRIVPRDHVCVTQRAVLGFHAASYYDDASRELVPTREGSALVMRLYPAQIRAWIGHHGGLTPKLITLRGHELTALYQPCQ